MPPSSRKYHATNLSNSIVVKGNEAELSRKSRKIERRLEMEITSVTAALLAVIKVFKRFCYFKDNSYYLILGLCVLLSYSVRFFDVTPYLLFVGPKDTGKTLVLDILQLLCYRAIRAEDVSEASLYHFTNLMRGTLLIDDCEDLSKRNQRKFNLSVVRGGYKKSGGVLRFYKGKLVRLNTFGLKAIASIGGIYDKALVSWCIQIKTVEAEEELERFSTTLHGKELKHLASGIEQLFKRKSLRKQIESLHRNFPRSISGLVGRNLELWIGILVLAQLIDEERVK